MSLPSVMFLIYLFDNCDGLTGHFVGVTPTLAEAEAEVARLNLPEVRAANRVGSAETYEYRIEEVSVISGPAKITRSGQPGSSAPTGISRGPC